MFGFLKDIWAEISGQRQIEQLKQVCDSKQKEIDTLVVARDELVIKVKQLNDQVYQLTKDESSQAAKILELQTSLSSAQYALNETTEQLVNANEDIEALKTTLAMEADIPAQRPAYLVIGTSPYLPNIQILTPKGEIETFKITHPQDMYSLNDFQKQIVLANKWRTLSKYKKLMATWKLVTDPRIKQYEYDFGDNWQLPLQTWYRKKGDCEDSTTLFVTIARACGIPADQIYNAVGPTSFGYHSYPIAYLDADDVKEMLGYPSTEAIGWYIFESTLHFLPDKPKKLVGSQYFIDNGLQNWQFAAQIDPSCMAQFNGLITRASAEERKIDNSEDKHLAIVKYWKNERQFNSSLELGRPVG